MTTIDLPWSMICRSLLMLLAMLIGGTTSAADSPTCNDAGLFSQGGVFTKVCWNCFFPITVAGVATSPGSVPTGHAGATCLCPGRFLGTPTPGIVLGMWQPMRVVELVRSGKGCSPTLGSEFELFDEASPYGAFLQGGGARRSDAASDEGSYFNAHVLAFPIGQLTDLLTDSVCAAESGSSDADILYASELDPTWNNEEISMFTTPEAVLFANPVALSACMADAVAATATQPISALFWCAGAWGNLYPLTGIGGKDSEPGGASLAATRAIAAMHRRGMANLAYSQAAVCRDIPWPTLPKNQYKLQTVHPIAETRSNHWIGAHTFRWGEWRSVPATGEDFVFLKWTFQECCMNF